MPERRVAFVVLTNGDAGEAVVREVADYLLASAGGVRRTEPPTVPLSDRELAAVAGRYAGGELEVSVTLREGGIVLDGVETDVSTGERSDLPTTRARSLGRRRFAVVEGQWDGERFDVLPATGPPEFLRMAGRLLPRA